jgi:phosphoribosylglycinamide formyltransferase-1
MSGLSEARIVVLISGQGRNLQAMIDHAAAGHIKGRIAGVISNRAEAGGLARATETGIATQVIPHQQFASRDDFDRALADAVRRHQPDIVVLAGFMRVLGRAFIDEFHGALVNIHPSLLPKYPGLKTHERALAAGDAEHGASVHFVTPEVDGGPVAIQGGFRLTAHDTAQTLAERVMQEVEVKIYPQAIAWLARGALRLADGRVLFEGAPLAKPLSMRDLEPAFR